MHQHDINIFISHAWDHSGHYDKLAEWIFGARWTVGDQPHTKQLNFENLSIPKENPIHHAQNTGQLQAAIFGQILRSHVVVIPMGMYANYSDWIQKEIDGSMQYKKPILAVDPFGQRRSSSIVRESCTKEVGWREESVVQGILDLSGPLESGSVV